MNEREEAAYIEGGRALARTLAIELIRELNPGEADPLRNARELSEVRAALRRLSEDLGCNDWPDSLWLPDVIERYIGRAVER